MVPSMLAMRRLLEPLTLPAALAADRLAARRPARTRPALRSRPQPWLPGRSRARLMIGRMRPMVAQMKRKRRKTR